jgi:hypothetical protein
VEFVLPLSTRMIVTFRSAAFNTSSPDKHFVSLRPYGSDLANWLMHELTQHDVAEEAMIAQQDAGWMVRFRFRGAVYEFLVRFRDPDWVGFLERRRGFLGRLFRGQQQSVDLDALVLVDSLLLSAELISDVCWHYDDSQKQPVMAAPPLDLTRLQ